MPGASGHTIHYCHHEALDSPTQQMEQRPSPRCQPKMQEVIRNAYPELSAPRRREASTFISLTTAAPARQHTIHCELPLLHALLAGAPGRSKNCPCTRCSACDMRPRRRAARAARRGDDDDVRSLLAAALAFTAPTVAAPYAPRCRQSAKQFRFRRPLTMLAAAKTYAGEISSRPVSQQPRRPSSHATGASHGRIPPTRWPAFRRLSGWRGRPARRQPGASPFYSFSLLSAVGWSIPEYSRADDAPRCRE